MTRSHCYGTSTDNKKVFDALEEDVFVLPTSFSQQRLWFLEQLEPGNPTYNIPLAVRLTGLLKIAALEQSLNEILRLHEALRTTFVTMGEGRLVQVITPSLALTLPIVNLQKLPQAEREIQAGQLTTEEAQRPFDLVRGPLLRTTLVRLGEEEHILLLVLHHIVFDNWSTVVLFRELAALYQAFSSGRPSPLPALPSQYADFVHWQRQRLQGEVLERQLGYWKQRLSDSPPVLELPTDHPRPPILTYRGARQKVELSKPLTEALKVLSRQHGVTLFMILLAAFQTLLQRCTGQDDLLVGSLIANRTLVEFERLIGCFVNTLVLRTDLSGNPTFRELLRRVREVCLGAYAHQDLPFEKLVQELQPGRDLSYHPLFQVMFILQDAPIEALKLSELTLSPMEVDSGKAKFDLTLSLTEGVDGLSGSLEYNTDLFETATITRMLGHFQRLLEGIVAHLEQRLWALPLLTDPERQQLLVEWNDTTTDYPRDQCLHRLFEAQVERTPAAVAVVCEEAQLTYQELNQRANQLAHYLQSLGVGPEVLVGICVERSVEMVIGLLGILKAGGAYMPLDPAYPQERLAFMLEDTRIPVLLTQKRLLRALPKHDAQVVCLDTGWESIARESEGNLPSATTPDNLAYVLYTSGSTGTPKGILGLHRGAVNRFAWMWAAYPFSAAEVCCQKTSLNFADSVWELFGPLLMGIRTVIILDEILKDPQRLVQTLAAQHVTRIVLVPSLLQTLLDSGVDLQSRLLKLKVWVTSGEILPLEIARRFQEARPDSLLNLYGSSEVSADVTSYDTGPMSGELLSVPIGRPIANMQVYILDQHLQPVPIGVPGELHIGGVGLARGYLNQPALTAEKFIPHPFSEEPGARLYKTGDLARYLPDGNIEFLGRLDHQVKLRGFRIELGEIETVLGRHPAIRKTVVTAREERPGDKRLVAYVVPRQEPAPTTSELWNFLQTKLPAHMLPSAFVLLDMLPLTPNGKVDRRALPAPLQSRPKIEKALMAPRDTLELQLTQIWQTVLNINSIDVRDNFFELGGHSLLAVRLFAQIEKTCGKNLPLATLFQAPTIEQLANLLRQDGWSTTWSSLVAIQPGGSKPPLFCVHAHDGGVLLYRDLAPRLGSDQPVYGLQARGLDEKQDFCTRIEDMAVHYIKEIRTLQPQGPYFLSGFCFGGTVAYEMAQQLQMQGQKVALLALFDTYGPGYPKSLPKTMLLRSKLSRHWSDLSQLGMKEQIKYVFTRTLARTKTLRQRVKWRMWRIAYKAYISAGHPVPRILRNISEVNLQAERDYVPQIYPGRVTLFWVSEQPAGCYPDPQLGWGGLVAGGLEIYEVPNDHDTMLRSPILAEQVQACLQQAQVTVSGTQT